MPEEEKPRGPLELLRVVELGSLIAGPFAGRLRADFGAEVIKVEAPGKPDPLRSWGAGEIDGSSLWWAVQSRGKRLVTLDLRQPRGQALLLDLLRESDVLIENFRPGTLERWGLAPDVLLQANPRLIIARVSGEGQTGPRASRPGFPATAEALSGLRYLNGFPGGPPPRFGLSLGDSVAALFAFNGILTALYWRDTAPDGRGQVVDVALTESCLALLESTIPDYDRFGVHLHDTRNTAVANALAALDEDATLFECSVGGAGGCPFAPGATGNLATEDLTWVLEREGVATGIDVDAVIEVAHWLESRLDRTLPGALSRPGCTTRTGGSP
jgi:crotonobetainyl-CoA:carnitine CoA-transferase CaiB-like acyl-CoA transferase